MEVTKDIAWWFERGELRISAQTESAGQAGRKEKVRLLPAWKPMVGTWHPISWLILIPIYSRMTYRASSYRKPLIQILRVASGPSAVSRLSVRTLTRLWARGGTGRAGCAQSSRRQRTSHSLAARLPGPFSGHAASAAPCREGTLLDGNADPFGQPVHYTALTVLQGYLLTITVWHIKGKKKLCKDLRPVDKPFSLSGFPVSGGLCVLGNRSTETHTQKLCTQVWPWDFQSQFYFWGQCQGAELCGTRGRWDLAGRGHKTPHTTGAGDASALPTLTLHIRAHPAELHLTCSTSILITGCLLVFLCSKEESVIKPKYLTVCSGQTTSADPAVSHGGSSRQAEQAASFHRVQGWVCVYIYNHRSVYTKMYLYICMCIYIYIKTGSYTKRPFVVLHKGNRR